MLICSLRNLLLPDSLFIPPLPFCLDPPYLHPDAENFPSRTYIQEILLISLISMGLAMLRSFLQLRSLYSPGKTVVFYT